MLFSAGDTDGTYKGKRYMFTPEDHGKFVKLKELRSILDIQVNGLLDLLKFSTNTDLHDFF